MDATLRYIHKSLSECQGFKSWLPNDEAVVIQKVCLLQGIFKIIKIETLKIQQMSSRFSKLTSLHILEMFTSAFTSQEIIVFLQSFAPKCLGSFIGTVAMTNESWNSHVTFTPRISALPWFLAGTCYKSMCEGARQHEDLGLNIISPITCLFHRVLMPQRSYDQISRGHTGLSNRTWNMSQDSYCLDRCCVCFTFYVKSLVPRKDVPRDFQGSF